MDTNQEDQNSNAKSLRRVWSFEDLRSNGLLWLINRVVFHPRGYALGFVYDDSKEIVGWTMYGNGSEPWIFSENEDEIFTKANNFLKQNHDIEESNPENAGH